MTGKQKEGNQISSFLLAIATELVPICSSVRQASATEPDESTTQTSCLQTQLFSSRLPSWRNAIARKPWRFAAPPAIPTSRFPAHLFIIRHYFPNCEHKPSTLTAQRCQITTRINRFSSKLMKNDTFLFWVTGIVGCKCQCRCSLAGCSALCPIRHLHDLVRRHNSQLGPDVYHRSTGQSRGEHTFGAVLHADSNALPPLHCQPAVGARQLSLPGPDGRPSLSSAPGSGSTQEPRRQSSRVSHAKHPTYETSSARTRTLFISIIRNYSNDPPISPSRSSL